MTCKDIIKSFLRSRLGKTIISWEFETVLPRYGEMLYGKLYTPGTYSRAWRDLRESGEIYKEFSIEEIEHTAKSITWKVDLPKVTSQQSLWSYIHE